jgi:glucose-1-phosphate cytidylyltransferase
VKAVILAGGLGSRISEESVSRPKPILWRIMKIYSHYGVNEFVICYGYKGKVIKEYLANYFLDELIVTFDRFRQASINPLNQPINGGIST